MWLRRHYGDCLDEGGSGPLAVIVGDSYLGRTKGSKAEPVAVTIGRRMGWRYVCRVRGGTGFVSAGDSDTFGVRIGRGVVRSPSVLLVEGGGNDNRHPHELVEEAARKALSSARDRLPHARIILLGPLALHQQDRARMSVLGKHLAAAADAAGVEHIDASDWFADGADGLVIADGVHPNERGADALADMIVKALH